MKYLSAAGLAAVALTASTAALAQSYGPYKETVYTLYAPTTTSNRQAVVVAHGNWGTGSRTQPNAVMMAQKFAAAGFTVYDIDYRLIGNYSDSLFPAPVQDTQLAIRFARSQGFKIVGVAGESAGAELAVFAGAFGQRIMTDAASDPAGETALLATYSSRPDFVVEVSGPVDQALYESDRPGKAGTERIERGVTSLGIQAAGRLADAIVSPISYIGGDMPPTIIFQGKTDRFIRTHQADELTDRLSTLGVKFQRIDYSGGHVFEHLPDLGAACLNAAVRFAFWKRPVLPGTCR